MHSWIENDTQDNAQAAAVKAGLTGRTHFVREILAGYEQLPLDRWVVSATADNAAAVATKVAAAGIQHVITAIAAGYNTALAGKSLQLKEGAGVLADYYIHDQFVMPLPEPIVMADNTEASLTLEASGTAGQIGAVTLFGYSVPTAGWLLELLDDTTVIFSQPIREPARIAFQDPLRIESGKAVTARLSPSGVAGNQGSVSLIGHSL